ncbi:hypothetical protein [Amycolatopsis silviterrae]|uniref:LppX_LprAFG lipoprotein n=1 Tax=Amycolatopsis silviterrae TaxID=1656914 RepID=A0ABW5HJH0_9PSEU
MSRCLLLAAAAALVCTSCSGSGENAAQSLVSAAASSPAKPFDAPPDAATVGETAASQLKMSVALHVKGGDSRKTKLDLQLNHDSAGGTIESDGLAMQLLRVGDKIWVKYNKGMADAARLSAKDFAAVDGKWVPMDSPMAGIFREALTRALDLDFFVGSVADDLDRPGYSEGEPVDLASAPAVRYRNGSRTIYLQRIGSSYELVRYESPKQGTLDFSGDGPHPFKAPAAEEIYSGPGS